MSKPITRNEIEKMADRMASSARENAYDTEEVPREDARDHGPKWYAMAKATAECIRDSLTDPREFSNYDAPRVLSSAEAAKVYTLCIARLA